MKILPYGQLERKWLIFFSTPIIPTLRWNKIEYLFWAFTKFYTFGEVHFNTFFFFGLNYLYANWWLQKALIVVFQNVNNLLVVYGELFGVKENHGLTSILRYYPNLMDWWNFQMNSIVKLKVKRGKGDRREDHWIEDWPGLSNLLKQLPQDVFFLKSGCSLGNLGVVKNKIAINDFFLENVYKLPPLSKNALLPPPYPARVHPQCGS